jgi:O-succinylbenzoic acid--CoA ligase
VAAPLNERQPARERDAAALTLGCDFEWTPRAADLLSESREPVAPRARWPLDRSLLRVCTSGSTGDPRCVELTLQQLWFNALGSNRRLGHRRDDRWLVCLPVNHIGALAAIFRCLHNRIALELHPRFDSNTVGLRLDSGDISLVSLVPSMLDAILDDRGEGPFSPHLRAILIGGAACREDLLQRCRKANLPLAISWGMTETASQVATREPGDLGILDEGIPALPWVSISVDADGRLVVTGPAARGTLVTDDLGEVTDEGRVRIFGRRDDVIIRGGENIHPREIEVVLEAHADVNEAIVLGKDDERLGQVPVAFVLGNSPEPEDLRQWCRGRLAGFKVPQLIHVLDEFPRAGLGKIDRGALRDLL